jgi:hypothetical protein
LNDGLDEGNEHAVVQTQHLLCTVVVDGHDRTQASPLLADDFAADQVCMVELVVLGGREVGAIDLDFHALQGQALLTRERRLAVQQHQLGYQRVTLQAAAATPHDLRQRQRTGCASGRGDLPRRCAVRRRFNRLDQTPAPGMAQH